MMELDKKHLDLKNDEIVKIIQISLQSLSKKYDVSLNEMFDILIKKYSDELLPVNIFNDKLGLLESVVKYLKENCNLRYSEIAKKINRDDRTVWTIYNKARFKVEKQFIVQDNKYYVPVSIFVNREKPVMKTLVSYLKDNFKLNYHEIAVLLKRDERNIWLSYNK